MFESKPICSQDGRCLQAILQGISNQKHRSPLVKGNHPELDTSKFLGQDGTDIYQSLVGAMQWAFSIGRWDIQSVVMTLSSF